MLYEVITVVQVNPDTIDLVIDSVMNHMDPRVSITVEEAGSRTAEDKVSEYTEGLVLEDFGIERSTIQFGGQEATRITSYNVCYTKLLRHVSLPR